MVVVTTVSALPATGLWGTFARRLIERFSAASNDYQQERMMVAVRELDHPGVLADMEAAARQR